MWWFRIIPFIFLLAACGRHESETYGYRDTGEIRRVERDTTPEGKVREAIRAGDAARVQIEISSSGLAINQLWSDGRTALIEAIISNQPAVVEVLIRAGGDPKITDREGMSALDHAAERPEIMRILEPPGADEQNALFLAIRAGDVENLRALLRIGADPNATDPSGETCLTLAVKSGSDAVVRTLLQDSRTNPSLKNQSNESPLGLARAGGHRRAEQMLLSKGARE